MKQARAHDGTLNAGNTQAMKNRVVSHGERDLVLGFKRRYLCAVLMLSPMSSYEGLAAAATADLSIGALRLLCDALKAEREWHRARGAHRLADDLTLAIRTLDSRVQVLDDLLH
jgi:hypothetical protein